MKSFIRWGLVLLSGLVLIALIGYLLVVYGVIRMNYPSKLIYPVLGIDISHHQGDVDFNKVAADGWDFVIMKSTEGGDWKDTRFSTYYQDAMNAGLTVGVYHYYSFCTDPLEQAEHYIAVTGDLKGNLPPAIDLEFDNNCNGAIAKEEFRVGLNVFIQRLFQEYGQYPIIYCNEAFYSNYLDVKDFDSCLFWIRNVVSQPDIGNQKWSFWQYTAKGLVSGIDGSVDLNAFNGRHFEFEELLLE